MTSQFATYGRSLSLTAHRLTRMVVFVLIGIGFTFSACAPQPGGPSPLTGKTDTAPATSPQLPKGSATTDGTVSGGGGNGIDGRAIESYRKNIESLPEYQRHVLPILRVLAEGRPDVMLAYLIWTARQKAWYFIPRELPVLSKDQTRLDFPSDQEALHFDHEILVDSQIYDQKSPQEKAFLLLHEMVMGARLLMKQSPLVQCQELSIHTQIDLCKDPEIMKIATNQNLSESERHILNGKEHEEVRTMTTFLLDGQQNLSGSNVSAARLRLDFVFPWEQAISHLGWQELALTLRREQLTGSVFTTEKNFLDPVKRICKFTTFGDYSVDQASYWNLDFYPLDTDTQSAPVHTPKKIGSVAYVSLTRFAEGAISAKGVPDPSGSNAIVDLIQVEPNSGVIRSAYDGPYANSVEYIFQFYLSRTKPARVLEIRAIPAHTLWTTVSNTETGQTHSTQESVIDESKAPVRCLVNVPK